jgi:predicted membrane GTPase involved in stress response
LVEITPKSIRLRKLPVKKLAKRWWSQLVMSES